MPRISKKATIIDRLEIYYKKNIIKNLERIPQGLPIEEKKISNLYW